MKTLLSLCASLAWGINCVLIFYAVYNVTVALPALKRRRTPRTFAPQKRFAILVAARNEESVIGGLVESLLAQDYPRGLFDVYVLPNNCSDDTAGAARRAGARILDCPGPIRCKGDALSYAFDLLLETGCYDAFCVFDADNLADKGFLRAMNSALCGGARAAGTARTPTTPPSPAATPSITGCSAGSTTSPGASGAFPPSSTAAASWSARSSSEKWAASTPRP